MEGGEKDKEPEANEAEKDDVGKEVKFPNRHLSYEHLRLYLCWQKWILMV